MNKRQRKKFDKRFPPWKARVLMDGWSRVNSSLDELIKAHESILFNMGGNAAAVAAVREKYKGWL